MQTRKQKKKLNIFVSVCLAAILMKIVKGERNLNCSYLLNWFLVSKAQVCSIIWEHSNKI